MTSLLGLRASPGCAYVICLADSSTSKARPARAAEEAGVVDDSELLVAAAWLHDIGYGADLGLQTDGDLLSKHLRAPHRSPNGPQLRLVQ